MTTATLTQNVEDQISVDRVTAEEKIAGRYLSTLASLLNKNPCFGGNKLAGNSIFFKQAELRKITGSEDKRLTMAENNSQGFQGWRAKAMMTELDKIMPSRLDPVEAWTGFSMMLNTFDDSKFMSGDESVKLNNLRNQVRQHIDTTSHKMTQHQIKDVEDAVWYDINRGRHFHESSMEKSQDILNKTINVEEMLSDLGLAHGKEGKKLNALVSHVKANKESHAQLTDLHAWMTKKDKLETKHNHLAAAQAVGQMGQNFGSTEVQVVAAVAQVWTQAKFAYDNFQKGKDLFDTLTNLTNLTDCANVVGAIINLVQLFSKKPEDPSVKMMYFMRELAKDIHTVRVELHQRFNEIERKMDVQHDHLMFEFSQIALADTETKIVMKTLAVELKDLNILTIDHFATLSKQIQDLTTTYIGTETRKQLGVWLEINNRVTGTHRMGDGEFITVWNKFITSLLTGHRADPFLVGPSQTSIGDFNIASLAPFVGNNYFNPTVYTWQVMGFVSLIERKYTRQPGSDRISRPEMNDLVRVQKYTEDFRQHVSGSRTNETFLALVGPIVTGMKSFTEQLKVRIETETAKLLRDLDTPVAVAGKDLFMSQPIPMKWDHPGWYTGTHQTWSHHSHKCSPKSTGSQACGNDYTQARIPGDLQVWDAFVTQVKQNQFKCVSNTVVNDFSLTIPGLFTVKKDNDNHKLLFPADPKDPILPVLPGMDLGVPKIFSVIEHLQLGQIKLVYHIMPHKEFSIHVSLHVGPKVYTHTIFVPYKVNSLYTGPEAVWRFWCGGPQHFDTLVNVHVQHTNTGVGTRDWSYFDYYSNVPTFKCGSGVDLSRGQNGHLLHATEVDTFQPADLAAMTKMVREHKATLVAKIFSTTEENSALEQALTKMEHNYTVMKTYMDVVFRDTPLNIVLLKYFSHTGDEMIPGTAVPFIRTREDFKRLVGRPDLIFDTGLDLVGVLEYNIEYFNTTVKESIESLFPGGDREGGIDNTFIDNLPRFISSVVEQYDTYGVMDENALVTQKSDNVLIREENKLRSDIMAAMGQSLLNILTPDQLKAVVDDAAGKLAEQGYEFEDKGSVLSLFGQRTLTLGQE